MQVVDGAAAKGRTVEYNGAIIKDKRQSAIDAVVGSVRERTQQPAWPPHEVGAEQVRPLQEVEGRHQGDLIQEEEDLNQDKDGKLLDVAEKQMGDNEPGQRAVPENKMPEERRVGRLEEEATVEEAEDGDARVPEDGDGEEVVEQECQVQQTELEYHEGGSQQGQQNAAVVQRQAAPNAHPERGQHEQGLQWGEQRHHAAGAEEGGEDLILRQGFKSAVEFSQTNMEHGKEVQKSKERTLCNERNDETTLKLQRTRRKSSFVETSGTVSTAVTDIPHRSKLDLAASYCCCLVLQRRRQRQCGDA